ASPPRLKVAVVTGTTQRFVVGDPSAQLLEGLAGSLVDELAAAEHDAEPGEIILASSTRASLGDRARTSERGVLVRSVGPVEAAPWPDLPEHADDLERFAPWILPPVYARLTAGHGDFIAELRPVTALFARFSGIDYDDDPDALGTLDRFTRAVQSV